MCDVTLLVIVCTVTTHIILSLCQPAEFTLASRESHYFSADHSKDRDAWVEAFTRVAVSVVCKPPYSSNYQQFVRHTMMLMLDMMNR